MIINATLYIGGGKTPTLLSTRFKPRASERVGDMQDS